jgi:hypothetical protein
MTTKLTTIGLISCLSAAFYCSKLLILLAPQVGLEPTTLRLTARQVHFSLLLSSVLYCLLSAACMMSLPQRHCGDYPQLPTFLKEYTHKIPHSENAPSFAFGRIDFCLGFIRELLPSSLVSWTSARRSPLQSEKEMTNCAAFNDSASAGSPALYTPRQEVPDRFLEPGGGQNG